MNTNIPQILRRPLTLTEKGATLKETLNKVMFEVARDASKTQIRAAVEGAFSVKVVDVRTMIVRGKMKRMGRGYAKTQNWKKAIVTLREGDKIDVFENQA
ncbi:MAG: 50S ribosomal protein L23 [Deltaproteobacteria bacterium]|jgi:large subunit ribosomal protein L23|nr:50S ribosomal protein L23 [Deltaproteobacteria bacterium]MBP6832731.1 50S ribosomal protein L23 [Deltaproteobacteria bacterium]TAK33059.1 MAG: 50S ribosomal protein L23 [Myxococcaceae bacterium]